MPARRTSTPAVQPVSLQEAKRHLRVDFDDADDDIQALIEVATRAAEDRTERTLITTSWAIKVDGTQLSRWLVLPGPPFIAVAGAEYSDGSGTVESVPPEAYTLDAQREPAQLFVRYGAVPSSAIGRPDAVVTIHYTAGYGPDPLDVPAPIRHWIKLAVGDLWAHRTRSAEKPAVPQGFADGLLDPYRMWGC